MAVPRATAVTVPLATVATEPSDEDQVIVWPDITAPVWLFTVAVSEVVVPKAERATEVLDRVIEVGTGVIGCVGVVPPPEGESPPQDPKDITERTRTPKCDDRIS